MFRKLSSWSADCEFSKEKLRLFIISAALLAFPFVSSQAQVVVSSPTCIRGLNNIRATCTGWARCQSPLFYSIMLRGFMSTYKKCPGYTVHNYASVYKLDNLTGIGVDGQTYLYSGGGPTLT